MLINNYWFVSSLYVRSTPEEGGETVLPEAEPKVTGDEWSECAKKGMAVKAVRASILEN